MADSIKKQVPENTPQDISKLFGTLAEPFNLPYKPDTLTVTMIIKNEAANIKAAVESFYPFADEIVINDTGSTDGTQKILDTLKVTWFQTEWQNDFSLARNQSLEKATSSWIIWLDADDRVPVDQVENFNRLKSAPLDRIFGFQIINTQAGLARGARFMQLRMFPNHPQIRFERKIHEQMVFSAARLGVHCFYLDTIIHHTGYEDENLKKEKAERNLALSKADSHLLGVDPTHSMSVGDSCYILERWNEGIEVYKKAFAIKDLQTINQDVYFILPTHIGIGYKKLGQFDEAHKWFDRAIKLNPESVEPVYHKAEMYHEKRSTEIARGLFKKILKMPLVHSSTGNQYDIFRMFSYHYLTDILSEEKNYSECLEVLEEMKKEYPEIVELYNKLGTCYLQLGQTEKALESFSHGLEINPTAMKELYKNILGLLETKKDHEAIKKYLKMAGRHFPHHNWTKTGPAPEKSEKPLISLCMIVKNEEANLPLCLESAAGLFDEMIIVDTGSTDSTVSIAEKRGARVFHFPWQDNFSLARNESLSKATGKWIMWLDADDQLTKKEINRIKDLLKTESPDEDVPQAGYGFLVHNSTDEGVTGSVFNQIRLFPNRDDIRFNSPVHEQVLPSIEKTGIPIIYTDIKIFHLGYSDPETGRKKQIRNKSILEEQVKKGEGVTPVTLYTLAHANFDLGYNEECIEQFILAVELAEKTNTDPHIIEVGPAKIAAALANLKRYAEALGVLKPSLQSPDAAPEAILVKAQVESALGNLEEAHKWYVKILMLEEKPTFIPVDVVQLKIKACEFLGRYCHDLAKDGAATEILKKGIALKTGSSFTYQNLMEIYKRHQIPVPS